MEMRYVSTDKTGWLRVKLDSGGLVVALPQYIKVKFIERRSGRDYFTIEEGVYKGKRASVSQKSGNQSWLGKPLPTYKGPANLVFKKSEGKLVTPIGNLAATMDTSNPIPNGRHPIQLPDFPHDLGRSYVSRASKAMTWFYLGTGNAIPGRNDRYLHPGRISAGCVTVTDLSKWDSLYARSILSRASGGKMLEQSPCKLSEASFWLTFIFLILFVYSGKVLSSDLGDQTSIINTYMQASSEDRNLAQSLAKQAHTRALDMGSSSGTNLGPLVKLWCDSAMIAPNPENLAECARFRFEAVAHMSNPQPSEKAVRMQRAKESLIMIRAALEIAGGDPRVSVELRTRLKNDSICFRGFINGESTSVNCYD